MNTGDYFAIDATGPMAGRPSPGRSNRNLSSVIHSIRDDGPSSVGESPAAQDSRPALDKVESAAAAATGPLTVTADARSRIRALPGRAVMSRVAGIVALMMLIGGGALLASGRYPVIDARGLHLVQFSADPVSDLASLWIGLEETATGWLATARQYLSSPGPAADPAVTLPAAQSVELDAQPLLERLEGLATTIAALQGQFQADRDAVAERDARLAVIETQLAALQQQAGARHASPDVTVQKQPLAAAGKPVTAQGGWVVNVASSSQEEPLGELQAKLLARNIQTELLRVDAGDRPRYRLRVTGFASSGEAQRYAATLAGEAGIEGAWAGRR